MKFNIWKDYKCRPLTELLSFIVDNRGKSVPLSEYGTNVLIATNCIKNENLYPTYENVRYFSDDVYENWFRAHPMPGDIIFVNKGTPGRTCMVPDIVDFSIAQDMMAFRVNEKLLDNRYLLCILRSHEIQELIRLYSVGDTIPHFKKQFLKHILIPVPPLNIQRYIGELYFNFSEKIELNNRINKNLEAQARTIYRDMFGDTNVDFKVGQLSDIADITMGQSPKGDTYNETGEGTIFYQGRAEFGFRFPTQRVFTTEPKRMAQENDVLMSVRAPVGDINIAHENCCIGRGLAAIRSKFGYQSFILYTMYALREQIDIFNGEGTVFGSINRDALNSLSVQIPSQEKIERFEELVEPMDSAIRKHHEENICLTAIRDTLLPRIMSGEIDVLNVEDQVVALLHLGDNYVKG